MEERRHEAYAALVPPPLVGTDVDAFVANLQARAAGVLKADGGPEALLRCVADMMEVFVCENFTGKLTDADRDELAAVAALGSRSDEAHLHRACLEKLVVDGEEMNVNVRSPLLLVALNALVEADVAGSLPVVHIWRARTYFTHQRCLGNRSHNLLSRTVAAAEQLLQIEGLEDAAAESVDLAAPGGPARLPTRTELHLFLGLVHHYYYEPQPSHAHLRKASALSGMKSKLTSMLGVRTEHQTFETAQLVVRAATARPGATYANAPFAPAVVEGSNVLSRPRKLKENIEAGTVDKDTVQEVAAEEDDAEVVDTVLTPLEQAVMMGLCANVRNNNPAHGLTEEERLAYIERLLGEPGGPWVLRSEVYLLRSRMEQHRVRVRERGLMQFCELCDQHALPVTDPESKEVLEKSTRHRYRGFWEVLYPPIFELRGELANVYMTIGMLKSALDMHEQLQNWSAVIKCCKRLDKRMKAESLIRERIEVDPTNAMLYSHLGDATRSEEYYLKAWEMSRHRLAAPMRGLGELYLEKERFADAVEAFDNALQLNPVFGANWFSMGWAAIRTGQWERASMCYTRNVQLDADDGQSWSNLATCYLQMGEKKLVQAYHCLLQAKKHNPSSWQILDNIFTVSVELGERTTALNTLQELVEKKGREYKLKGSLVRQMVHGVIAALRGEEEVNRTQYKLRRKAGAAEAEAEAAAAAEAEAAAAAEEDDLSLDDEIFDVVPFGADMDLDVEDDATGPTDVQVERRRQEAQAVEKAQVAALRSLKQKCHNVLGKVTTIHTSDWELYCAYADFLEGCDNMLEAFDQRLKDLRCLSKRGWQAERHTAVATIESATRLAVAAAKVPEDVLAERAVKTMAPKGQARMQVQPVVKLAEDAYGTTPEYARLKEAVAALE